MKGTTLTSSDWINPNTLYWLQQLITFYSTAISISVGFSDYEFISDFAAVDIQQINYFERLA